jgi:SdpC family antimicrobial peptide
MRRMSWKRVAATALAAAVAAATLNGGGPAMAGNWSPPAAQAGPASSAVNPAQDGRDLFRAVFYLAGPHATVVADALSVPDEWRDLNRSAEITAHVDAITAKVGEIDPAFFASFADRLRSGDPFAVEQAVIDGRALIQQATEALGAAAEPGYADRAGQGALLFAPLVAVAAVVAVLVSAVAAANVGVAIEAFAVIGSAGTPGEEGLSVEQSVAALTEAFAR